MNHLVAIVGPTAVGKSDLAFNLAERLNGEIVNSDSRQIYRHMNIGTAKPSLEDLKKIHHHLIDIKDPDQDYSLAIYHKTASQVIDDIFKHGKIPFLVGGTGQYVWSVLEGWNVPQVKPDQEFRKTLEEQARANGYQSLFDKLKELDPVAAQTIMPTNIRRVIRALEIHKYSNIPASSLWQKKGVNFKSIIIGLTMSREALYERIDHRVDKMMEAGLIDEVKNLLKQGYRAELPAMSSIGYRQIIMYLQGQLSLEDAIEKIKTETHRFARRQYTWFKLTDNRIIWFDVYGDIKDNIYTFLQKEIQKAE
jgi:tRNA dimethylallyltransferase